MLCAFMLKTSRTVARDDVDDDDHVRCGCCCDGEMLVTTTRRDRGPAPLCEVKAIGKPASRRQRDEQMRAEVSGCM